MCDGLLQKNTDNETPKGSFYTHRESPPDCCLGDQLRYHLSLSGYASFVGATSPGLHLQVLPALRLKPHMLHSRGTHLFDRQSLYLKITVEC